MQTYSVVKCLSRLVCFGVVMAAMRPAMAQTLARPGWVGSGLAAEPWWRTGVIYRVTTAGFQDSNGDGVGDLRGLASRMDYLQGLGVDAVLLDTLASSKDVDAQFDEVISAASQHRLRVLMTVEDGGNTAAMPDSNVVALARLWLTRGATGIFFKSKQSAADAAPLLHRLRALTDSFPGSRVLLAETATNPAPSTIHAISLDDIPPTPSKSPGRAAAGKQPAGAQLVEVPLELANATAKTIRAALNGVNNSSVSSGGFFLNEQLFSTEALLDPANVASLDGRRRAFAMVLLASHGAGIVHYGQEIGLLSTMVPSESKTALMQWTVSNVTPAPKVVAPEPVKVETKPAPVAKGSDEEYGTYRPYVPPPKNAPPVAAAKPGQPEATVQVPAVDLESLPGFTSGKLPVGATAVDAKTLNVAHEDVDENSLLNLYRRLIQLHHDNPTLRTGAETLLDYDDLGAVVWVRQPPKGSVTTTAIIAVCNLSGIPLHLSLNAELTRQHVHTGMLRNLLSTQASATSVQSTDDLALPPYGVFLGELYH